jgi:5-methylcytosine-specific restriction protein A
MARLSTIPSRLATLPAKLQAPERYGRGRGGRPWRRLVEQVKLRDQYTCRCCGRITEQGQCDHVIPTAEGGSDDLTNLQWLCIPCHETKSKAEAARGAGGTPHPR